MTGVDQPGEQQESPPSSQQMRDVSGLGGLLFPFLWAARQERAEQDMADLLFAAWYRGGRHERLMPYLPEQAVLWWSRDVWFAYDQAKRLLAEIEAPGERETVADGTRRLTLSKDDLAAAYGLLYQRYGNAMSFWRDVAYWLHARFPDVPRDRGPGRPRQYQDAREWVRVQLPVDLVSQLRATDNMTAFIERAIRAALAQSAE